MTRLILGNCLEVMATLDDASVDSIVTDPPYHLTAGKKGGTGEASVNLDTPHGRARISTGFMGMTWDGGSIAFTVELWREALRVLKPGGHLLAFSGSRTYHRMTCAIEDAGFEIRDQIMWVYGSGFPKSLDVSKAIDKAAGAERARVPGPKTGGMAALNKGNAAQGYRDEAYYAEGNMMLSDEPATDAARQWDGWGTALKPAHEPICVARKPLIGTVATNVLAHGTGAINIDGCRVPVADASYARNCSGDRGHADNRKREMEFGMTAGSAHASGRWPANIIHDGSAEVVALFPAQAVAAAPVHTRGSDKFRNSYGSFAGNIDEAGSTFHGDSGSAARFFYCAKTSKADRGTDNIHPTVKPTDLMAYLVRLVTPPGGVVLDPFMGSGSTGKACVREGFDFIGIELDPGYLAIAEARIAHEQARAEVAIVSPQADLFQEGA